jgi:hypothetical protein
MLDKGGFEGSVMGSECVSLFVGSCVWFESVERARVRFLLRWVCWLAYFVLLVWGLILEIGLGRGILI